MQQRFSSIYALLSILAMLIALNVISGAEAQIVPVVGYLSMLFGGGGFFYQLYLYWKGNTAVYATDKYYVRKISRRASYR